jgi:hypothetical protein
MPYGMVKGNTITDELPNCHNIQPRVRSMKYHARSITRMVAAIEGKGSREDVMIPAERIQSAGRGRSVSNTDR